MGELRHVAGCYYLHAKKLLLTVICVKMHILSVKVLQALSALKDLCGKHFCH